MRILYVCHRFPYPPKRGGKIRPFNMIRHLGAQGHRVSVASLARSEAEAREAEGIRDHCAEFTIGRVSAAGATARMLTRLPTPVPSSMGYFHCPALARTIDEWLGERRFDLILVHCSSVAPYVARVRGTPKLLDFGDMDSQKWLMYSRFRPFPLSLGYRLEGAKLQRAEMALARRFDLCTCTTRAELQTLDGYLTGARTGWFPNGVDAQYFSPPREAPRPDTLCFVGRMDYYPNQQAMLGFCRDVLPLLRERRPDVALSIVGASPPARIRALGRQPGVTVTGSVPDVRPHAARAAVGIAPLAIARGTQNKILESMAMGLPVVTSPEAAGGVNALPGEHLLVAGSPREYRDAILGLLEDPGARERLGRAARARVLSHHDWERSMALLDALIEECIEAHRTRAVN